MFEEDGGVEVTISDKPSSHESSTQTLIDALKRIAEDMHNYNTFSESNRDLYYNVLSEAADRLYKQHDELGETHGRIWSLQERLKEALDTNKINVSDWTPPWGWNEAK